jgi:hypothetical protein
VPVTGPATAEADGVTDDEGEAEAEEDDDTEADGDGLAGLGVGAGVGDAVGLAVGDAVGDAVGGGLGVAVGGALGVGVGLGVALGVGVGVADGGALGLGGALGAADDGAALGAADALPLGDAAALDDADALGSMEPLAAEDPLGTVDGAAEKPGRVPGACVTGRLTFATAAPPWIAVTPSRFCQTVGPSTIPPFTTYVAAGSVSPGSKPTANPMFVGSLIGVTDRLTTVPVSTLMSAAIDTASGESTVPVGGTVVPSMVAGGLDGTAVKVSASPEVGPPVMTGSPTWFCDVLVPSVIVARRTYACVWSMVPGSNATAKSIGT